jgi:hypothetical protein
MGSHRYRRHHLSPIGRLSLYFCVLASLLQRLFWR